MRYFSDAEYLYTEEEVDDALWALADKEFGGKKENGVFWVVGPKRQTKLKKYQKYHCAFYNCCSCLTEVQLVYSKEEGRYWIEITSKVPHDHVMKKKSHGPLKSALVACIDSPSKLKVAPKALVGRASIKMGQTFTQDQQVALKRAIGILYTTKDLKNGGNGSYYGDVVESLLNKYHRDNIGDSFTRDTVFLVGGRVNVDEVVDNKASDGVRFYCVSSTENLLLNGPRQVMSGQQIILAVDGSYRYVIERDHGLFVVKTINHCQSAKTIAYAICNREDKVALKWIFGTIKEEIEYTVNQLIDNDIGEL